VNYKKIIFLTISIIGMQRSYSMQEAENDNEGGVFNEFLPLERMSPEEIASKFKELTPEQQREVENMCNEFNKLSPQKRIQVLQQERPIIVNRIKRAQATKEFLEGQRASNEKQQTSRR
jgi:hypothetical protein